MSAPVGVVMRRAAELAASRLGGEAGRREARTVSGGTAVATVLRPRTCTYCPGRALHGHVACHAHSDLIALDPFFSPDVPQAKAEPIEDVYPDVLPDRLLQIGA